MPQRGRVSARWRSRRSRRLLFLPFGTLAFVLTLASVAWACVTFQGKFQVDTAHGSAVGFGSGYHPDSGGVANIEYCRPVQGAPAKASRMMANQIRVSFSPYGGCNWVDPADTESETDGARADEGTYFVRIDTRETFCRLLDSDCPPGELEAPDGWPQDAAGWFRMSLDPDGNPVGDQPHIRRGAQCFFPPNHPGFQELVASGDVMVLDGHLTVNERGHGQGMFTIPRGTFTAPTNTASVCTREMRPPEGLGHPGPPHASQLPIMVL